MHSLLTAAAIALLAAADPVQAASPVEGTAAIEAHPPTTMVAVRDAGVQDLRGTFRVTAIEGETLRIAISFPLNGKPRLARNDEGGLITADPRHLNGTLIARPALLKREVVLRIDHLLVPGASVPREFIGQMSPYRITERYLQHPVLGPAMARLTSVAVSDGRLVLRRMPGEPPPDTITDEQVDQASTRLFTVLGIASTVFLLFAGAVVFIGLRAKSARP